MQNQELAKKLQYYTENSLIREIPTVTKHDGADIYLGQKKYLNFCANDYLGIKNASKVQQAIVAAAKFGLGSGASPLVSGYHSLHKEFELQMAEFLQRDSAILYGSGYLANIGVITTFANKNSTILLDKLCHASLIDAALLSQANYKRYPHNDVNYLQRYFQQHPNITDAHLVTEGVFSMEGNMAKIVELVGICKPHAKIIIDDTHGIGILGTNKAGVCAKYNLTQDQVPVIIASLAMAFASYGAIVAGSKATIDMLRQFSRTYIYASTLPPAISYINSKILRIIQSENWRHEKLAENIEYFNLALANANIATISSKEMPIKSVIVQNNQKCLQLQAALKKHGILVAAIRPPTVPANTARLKITINALHTKNDIKKLIAILQKNHD